jgi:FAD/FMN-containing dehydrogenase
VVVQGTSCHCEFNLYYDPAQPAEAEATRLLATRRAIDLVNMGAFFSRPYGAWASMAYNRMADTTVMERKVKDIFDPNGILNPGKLCF